MLFESGGKMKSKLKVFIAIIIFGTGLIYSQRSLTDIAEPDQMSPSEIYARCYAKLLRKPAPSNSATLTALRSGSISDAENECVNLLNKASLDPTTGTVVNPNDSEARDILTTFQMLHNSWFASQTLIKRDTFRESKLVSDIDEPGLYWTRALLRNGARADSVLNYNKSLKAIRVRSDGVSATHFQSRPFFNYAVSGGGNFGAVGVNPRDSLFRIQFMKDISLDRGDGTNYSFIDVPDDQLTNFGEMIGVKDQKPLKIERIIPPFLIVDSVSTQLKAECTPKLAKSDPKYAAQDAKCDFSLTSGVNAKLRDPTQEPNLNIDLPQNFGGGIMGSTVYAMKNTSFVQNQLANSYSSIDRRLASRVFQDLLCYQLPILKEEDVDTIADPPGNEFPFHQSKSCMQCHATIDEFAMINKNMTWVTSSVNPITFGQEILDPKTKKGTGVFRKPALGAEITTLFKLPVVTGAKTFALQDPIGELHFRTFDNTKIHLKNIRSLAQVGAEFSKLDDFYTCAAKRYYRYFTGIDVPLSKDAESTLNSVELGHLDTVRKLGLQLKADPEQNLKNIVISIFKSEAFQSRDYKTQGVGK